MRLYGHHCAAHLSNVCICPKLTKQSSWTFQGDGDTRSSTDFVLECVLLSTVPEMFIGMLCTMQEDVERLKEVASALEAEVPAKKAGVKKLNACVEEMTARLVRKKKILKQFLAQFKKLKTQEKVRWGSVLAKGHNQK